MSQTRKDAVDLKQMNHNIRNPLYIAKTLLEAHLESLNRVRYRNGNDPGETKAILKKSVMEINRALTTLTRLNRLAQFTRARLSGNGKTEQISIKDCLLRVISALKEEHYLDHLILIDWISAKLPNIDVNSVDVEEIFYNLIINAAQAMIGGGQLAIEAIYEESPVPQISVSFRDTGSGIPEEALKHIFEPFVTVRSESGKTGFGLHIVKQLAERNRGQVKVASRRFIGSTFTVTFPAPKVKGYSPDMSLSADTQQLS